MSGQECKNKGLSLGAFLFPLSFFILLCLSVCISAIPSFAINKQTSKAIFSLRTGITLLEKEKYNEALENFKLAYDELPDFRDYTLLFMAKAYRGLDRLDNAGDCIHQILKTYPDSQVKKKARAFELKSIIQDDYVYSEHLESYVADYPEDAEMSLLLARLLRKNGKTDVARKILIRLYTGNSSYSELALRELRPSDITADDILVKVSNLLKVAEYQKAETALRKLLPVIDNQVREEIQKKLGLSLFGQKKYRQAAESFLKSGDLYNSARSSYRAGDLQAFEGTVAKLVSMDDKRAGSLLLTYAAKKRRDGEGEEALKIYDSVKDKYPSLSEDAMWGMAWTHYRTGNHDAALSLLTELDRKYSDSKYRYWKQRCSQTDFRPKDSQSRSKGYYKDIYGFMAELKDTDRFSGRMVRQAAWSPGPKQPLCRNSSLPSDVRIALERFAILAELDMRDDAVTEIIRAANRLPSSGAIVCLCRALQEAGAYHKSLTVISRLPEKGTSEGSSFDIKNLRYPFAYWSIVREIADRYELDPLFLLSVMREESRFDPSARSAAGALGLMQIMPQTAYRLDRKLDMKISEAAEIYNIRTNITVGAYYLNSLLKEFGSLAAALAAYNAGHDKVREWLKTGNYAAFDEFIEDIPYDETRNYVKRVLLTYSTYLNIGDTP